MKTPVFTGTCTALITPFQASGSIDYAAFARQMDRQLESGVDALCVCGTTGESSTLTVQEHVHLVDYCVSHVAGRCKVVAGSGSNDTAAALYLCQHAQESGADALLLVTPYYNKTTQTGLIHHYESGRQNRPARHPLQRALPYRTVLYRRDLPYFKPASPDQRHQRSLWKFLSSGRNHGFLRR